jgi:hypothetical protein
MLMLEEVAQDWHLGYLGALGLFRCHKIFRCHKAT